MVLVWVLYCPSTTVRNCSGTSDSLSEIIHCRPYHLPALLTQRGHKVTGAFSALPKGPLLPRGWIGGGSNVCCDCHHCGWFSCGYAPHSSVLDLGSPSLHPVACNCRCPVCTVWPVTLAREALQALCASNIWRPCRHELHTSKVTQKNIWAISDPWTFWVPDAAPPPPPTPPSTPAPSRALEPWSRSSGAVWLLCCCVEHSRMSTAVMFQGMGPILGALLGTCQHWARKGGGGWG